MAKEKRSAEFRKFERNCLKLKEMLAMIKEVAYLLTPEQKAEIKAELDVLMAKVNVYKAQLDAQDAKEGVSCEQNNSLASL